MVRERMQGVMSYKVIGEPAPLMVRVTRPDRRGSNVSTEQRHLAVGEYSEGRKVIGLCVSGTTEWVGHMSYNWDDDARLISAMLSIQEPGWHFDAGGSMPEIVASPEDLKQALIQLGVVEGEES